MKNLVCISEETLNVFLDDLPNNLLKVVLVDNSGLYQVRGNAEAVKYSDYALQVINFITGLEDVYDVTTEFVTHGEHQYIQFVKKEKKKSIKTRIVTVVLTDDDHNLYGLYDEENDIFVEKGFLSQIEAVEYAISQGWSYKSA